MFHHTPHIQAPYEWTRNLTSLTIRAGKETRIFSWNFLCPGAFSRNILFTNPNPTPPTSSTFSISNTPLEDGVIAIAEISTFERL